MPSGWQTVSQFSMSPVTCALAVDRREGREIKGGKIKRKPQLPHVWKRARDRSACRFILKNTYILLAYIGTLHQGKTGSTWYDIHHRPVTEVRWAAIGKPIVWFHRGSSRRPKLLCIITSVFGLVLSSVFGSSAFSRIISMVYLEGGGRSSCLRAPNRVGNDAKVEWSNMTNIGSP